MTNPFTKGYCEVTAIDSLIIMATIIAGIFAGIFLYAVYETYIKQ